MNRHADVIREKYSRLSLRNDVFLIKAETSPKNPDCEF